MRWILPSITALFAGLLMIMLVRPVTPWQAPEAIPPALAPWQAASMPERGSDFSQALSRPLFWPSRRPVVENRPPVSVDLVPVFGVSVLGLIEGGGGATIIVRSDSFSGRVPRGGEVDGWIFDRVDASHAGVVRGGQEVRVEITRPRVDDQKDLRMERPVYPVLPGRLPRREAPALFDRLQPVQTEAGAVSPAQ
jgi:hypothetical protein